MGADLYLNSVFQPNFNTYKLLFDEWVQHRDRLQQQGQADEAQAAHVKVEEYYDKLYAHGYFRDSYNATSLLRLFGVSWWGDVSTLLDDDNNLSPSQAQTLLQLLAQREPIFEENLQEPVGWEEWADTEVETYFREKYRRFQAFLQEAISLNEPIFCSV
jgi:hypothetical protein